MEELYLVIFAISFILLTIIFYIYNIVVFFQNEYHRIISIDTMNYHKVEYKKFDSVYQLKFFYIEQTELITLVLNGLLIAFFFMYFTQLNNIFQGKNSDFQWVIDYMKKHQLHFLIIFIIALFAVDLVYKVLNILFLNSNKRIYEVNEKIQNVYDYFNRDFLLYLTDEKNKIKTYEKLLDWGFTGDNALKDANVGNRDNVTDMIEKRLRIFVTFVFYKFYITNRNDNILSKENIGKKDNLEKDNIFLNLPENGYVLPELSLVKKNFPKIFTILQGISGKYIMNTDDAKELSNKYNDLYASFFENVNIMKKQKDSVSFRTVRSIIEIVIIVIYAYIFIVYAKYLADKYLFYKK